MVIIRTVPGHVGHMMHVLIQLESRLDTVTGWVEAYSIIHASVGDVTVQQLIALSALDLG
jgi:hypothetical protein